MFMAYHGINCMCPESVLHHVPCLYSALTEALEGPGWESMLLSFFMGRASAWGYLESNWQLHGMYFGFPSIAEGQPVG